MAGGRGRGLSPRDRFGTRARASGATTTALEVGLQRYQLERPIEDVLFALRAYASWSAEFWREETEPEGLGEDPYVAFRAWSWAIAFGSSDVRATIAAIEEALVGGIEPGKTWKTFAPLLPLLQTFLRDGALYLACEAPSLLRLGLERDLEELVLCAPPQGVHGAITGFSFIPVAAAGRVFRALDGLDATARGLIAKTARRRGTGRSCFYPPGIAVHALSALRAIHVPHARTLPRSFRGLQLRSTHRYA